MSFYKLPTEVMIQIIFELMVSIECVTSYLKDQDWKWILLRQEKQKSPYSF